MGRFRERKKGNAIFMQSMFVLKERNLVSFKVKWNVVYYG